MTKNTINSIQNLKLKYRLFCISEFFGVLLGEYSVLMLVFKKIKANPL